MDYSKSNELYKDLDPEFGVNLYRFNGLDIPFNPSWKNIGINLSGGADSSCLLMLLCKIIKKENSKCRVHIIQFQRCWNTRPWQKHVAQTIFDKFQELFPDIDFIQHKHFIPISFEESGLGVLTVDQDGRMRSGVQIAVDEYNQYAAYNNNLDALYNAITQNPDIEILKKPTDRNKLSENGNLKNLLFESNGRLFIFPFRFVKKDWIVSEYRRQGFENLYATTRSCEGSIGHETIKDIIPTLEDYKPGMYVPTCNECYWCLERSWAENKANNQS